MKKVIIIGAGPAGLTAAYELLKIGGFDITIVESSGDIGGISKTVNYKGNRIDLGGHRFFSKSDRVMQWWRDILPLQGSPSRDEIMLELAYKGQKRDVKLQAGGPDPEKDNLVMLIRRRLSRIFFMRKFFDYPVSLNGNTIRNLGVGRIIRIGFSYIAARLFPIRHEKSLEDFFINRFGKALYRTFFMDYTEKVWGVHCKQIKPEWGAQRIKGLSASKALGHAIKSMFRSDKSIDQKKTETSLIEQFMYPKLGPGQMWETVAEKVQSMGGKILMHHLAETFRIENDSVSEMTVRNTETGKTENIIADYFFSTMPVKDLVAGMRNVVPDDVKKVASGLIYRDFMTVGLLLNRLKIKNNTSFPTPFELIPDSWIYIQERDVKVGRLQIFNNWSPYMVKDPSKVWIGLEYFCNEGDNLWSMADTDFVSFAIEEMSRIGIIESNDVIDSTVLRMPKTYPAYFGTYDDFGIVQKFTDGISNLFLVGRNGMHRYNNQDHSMLTAMTAVENIVKGRTCKENIWNVNTEQDYHEEK